jgi:hypothetical protein
MVGTLITSLIACVFLAIAAWAFRSVRARRLWPVAPGAVTGGAIRQRTSGVGDDESVTFVPVVEYRYQIGAVAYTGSGIGFGEIGYGSRGRAEKVLARYPVGSAIDVYYNPAKPAQTFLEAGGGAIAWSMLAVGVAILMVAVVLGIYRI